MSKVLNKLITKPILALVVAAVVLAGVGVAQASVAVLTNPNRIEGIISEYSPNRFIEITDTNGNSVIFKLSPNTKYVPSTDIEEGDTAFVRGEKNGNENRATATMVRKIKDKNGDGYGSYGGECTPVNVNRSLVTKKSNDGFVVVRDNVTYRFLVSNQTIFLFGASNYAELEVGDYVEVEGTQCENSKLPQAVKVYVSGGNNSNPQ